MKKLVVIITVMSLLMSMWIPVFAADKVEAVTVRLAKTEGDGVSVTTNSDKAVKTTGNMRLFSGYKVGTDKSSFAFLSLDDSKAVKLDKNTKVVLKKQGNKNEVILSAGKLFFDVEQKLKSSESMQIETSNVSMGIRGTSGVTITVYVRDTQGNIIESHTIIQLYDGETYLEIRNPKTGEMVKHTLTAGNWVDVTENMKTGIGEVLYKKLEASDIPSFAIDEILSNQTLIGRFEEGTAIPKEELQTIKDATAREEAAQEAAREKDQANAEDTANNESNLTPAPDAPAGGGGAASGGGGSSTLPTTELTGAPSVADINAALAAGNVSLAAGSTATIGTGNTLPVISGRTLTNSGTLDLNGGTLNIDGTLTNQSMISGTTGTINNNSMNSLYNNGVIGSGNTINNYGKLVNGASGQFGGRLSLFSNSRLENYNADQWLTVMVSGSNVTIINSGNLNSIALSASDTTPSAVVTNTGTISAITAPDAPATLTFLSAGLILGGFSAVDSYGRAISAPQSNTTYTYQSEMRLWTPSGSSTAVLGSGNIQQSNLSELFSLAGISNVMFTGNATLIEGIAVPSGKTLILGGGGNLTSPAAITGSGIVVLSASTAIDDCTFSPNITILGAPADSANTLSASEITFTKGLPSSLCNKNFYDSSGNMISTGSGASQTFRWVNGSASTDYHWQEGPFID